jgi:hypothetical protein
LINYVFNLSKTQASNNLHQFFLYFHNDLMNFFINIIKKSKLKGYLLNNTILNTIHLEL